MKRVSTPLATALMLALAASSAVHALELEEPAPQQIWSARPSLRLSQNLPAANLLISPVTPLGESVYSAGVIIDGAGHISLSAGLGAGANNEDGLATLPWCAEASGLLRIGALGHDCLMQGTLQMELPGRVATASTGAQWQGDRFDLSLAYGYSWLVPNQGDAVNVPFSASQDLRLSPLQPLPTLAPGTTFEAQALGVNSQWRLTPESALQLNAALHQLRLRNGMVTPALDLQRAMLDVGLNYGAFSGSVTGRVNRLAEQPGSPNAIWSGIDIGVSWRTPWRGELTLGARNVVSKTDSDAAREPARVIDETSARTPYVRYKQDL